jgi:hypothetical protein
MISYKVNAGRIDDMIVRQTLQGVTATVNNISMNGSFIYTTTLVLPQPGGQRQESVRSPITTLNLPNREGGANSSHMHNRAKSQSYRGLKLLLSDTKFMSTVKSMFNYHRFQEN